MDLLWGPIVDHGAYYKAAIEQNKPLVVYINMAPRDIPGTFGYFSADFFGRKDPQVLIGYPKNGTLLELPLSCLETDKEIKKQIDKVMESVKPTVTQKSAGPLHTHRCPTCGATWTHGHESTGNQAAHTCPSCGMVTYGNIISRQSQPAIIRQYIQRQDCPNGQCPYPR